MIENRKLIVLGAGGHGRVVVDAAMECASHGEIAVLDDNYEISKKSNKLCGVEVIGTIDEAFEPSFKEYWGEAFVGIGNNAELRLKLLTRLALSGYKIPNVIHPSATVSKYASIGFGNAIFAKAVVQAYAVIENGVILNTSCTVDHDSVIRNGAHICPGSNIAGSVEVGERSWIGIGSCVKEGTKIGSDVIVGAGAAVVSDLEMKTTAIGIPARIKEKKNG